MFKAAVLCKEVQGFVNDSLNPFVVPYMFRMRYDKCFYCR